MTQRTARTGSCPSARTALLVLVVLGAAVVVAAAIAIIARSSAARGRDELDRLCAVNPGVAVRDWTHIIIHHSGTDAGDAASFDRYHRKLGWARGLGYDFVIGNGTRTGDGQIEVGERWKAQLDGAHCRAAGMNRRAIGICFVGDFETTAGPTDAQLAAGTALVGYLARRFDIPPGHVLGHGDVPGARTDCPGRHFPMDALRSAAAGR
ncbi:MAG: peptidoglycan recognition family protein [Planctomycetota bacterium]